MKELKKHASQSEQVEILISRGLIINDRAAAEKLLSTVNYYRFTGYLHDYKQPGKNLYMPGITIDKIKKIYDFDRKFTRILMFALEDIEETLKTRISYVLTSSFPNNPLIYMDPQVYRDTRFYNAFLKKYNYSVKANKNVPFVKHHMLHYNGFLPMWVAVELFTMGNLHKIFDNLLTPYQKKISKLYGTGVNQLSSWIENLTYTRNHLAHYMRMYNYNFGRSPKQGTKPEAQFSPTNMIFDQIKIMSIMHSNPTEWNEYILKEIEGLLNEYDADVEMRSLSFPEDWLKQLQK